MVFLVYLSGTSWRRVDNVFQRINPYPADKIGAFLILIGQWANFIHWIVIYLLDKVIHSSYNRILACQLTFLLMKHTCIIKSKRIKQISGQQTFNQASEILLSISCFKYSCSSISCKNFQFHFNLETICFLNKLVSYTIKRVLIFAVWLLTPLNTSPQFLLNAVCSNLSC